MAANLPITELTNVKPQNNVENPSENHSLLDSLHSIHRRDNGNDS